MPTHASPIASFLPALVSAAAELPWIPTDTPGKSFKLLRLLDQGGFVELLRMEPGTVMPLHRHLGPVHALNLSGERTLCTGEVIGAGDYVFEPAGNVDWWKVTGNETLVCFVLVMGDVEYLHADGTLRQRITSAWLHQAYERHCAAQGMPVRDLWVA